MVDTGRAYEPSGELETRAARRAWRMRTRRTLHTRRTLVRLSIITQRIIRVIQLPIDVSATTDSVIPLSLNDKSSRRARSTELADCVYIRKCASFLFLFMTSSPPRSLHRERRILQGISSASVCVRSLARSRTTGKRCSHRRSTLPHTDCKLLCYNFLSIN